MPDVSTQTEEQKQPDNNEQYNQFGFFVGDSRNTWDCDELAAGNDQDVNDLH